MRLRTAFLLALIPAAALGACGGAPTGALPPSAAAGSMASDALDALAAPVAGSAAPSLVVGLQPPGGAPSVRAWGNRSLAPPAAADPSTLYQVGSLTKAFTAAAVLLLAERGALRLDDPLSVWLPAYAYADRITLRQMLNQVSGIPADADAGFTTGYAPFDHASVIARLSVVPLDFAPGTRFEYSNANYWLLGEVIARASGMPYAQFVTQNIFAPLGLTRIGFIGGTSDADAALGTTHANGTTGPFIAAPSWSYDYAYAMGGIVADAADLLRWDAALRAPGFLDDASRAAMFTPPAAPAGTPYAMGWFVDPDGTRYHLGETNGFICAQALYADGWDVVVLANVWDRGGGFDPVAFLQRVHATVAATHQ